MSPEKTNMISYAIPVCNELNEISRLIDYLIKESSIRSVDEIIVLYDTVNGTEEVKEYLDSLTYEKFTYYTYNFDGNFAAMKNYLTSLCNGDWIFQIDADEMPSEHLISVLPELLEQYKDLDLLFVPRINTVEGITQEHISRWGWNFTNDNWINWPDWQCRLYRNRPGLRWKNKVHETLSGYKLRMALPAEEKWALRHDKTIERQEKQNEYYSSL